MLFIDHQIKTIFILDGVSLGYVIMLIRYWVVVCSLAKRFMIHFIINMIEKAMPKLMDPKYVIFYYNNGKLSKFNFESNDLFIKAIYQLIYLSKPYMNLSL